MVLVYRRLWLGVSLCLVALVVYLSLVPHPPTPLTFEHADKLEHGLAYATLALCFCQIFLAKNMRVLILAALIFLGVALEFVQGWTGYRTFDVLDMAANSVGVLLGYMLALTPLGRVFGLIETVMKKSYGH
ncbi:MAG: VanZ family protein [Gallionella sp.]